MLLAFFSLHSSPMYYCRSAAAEDITLWEKKTLLDGRRCTYSSVAETSGGTLLLFYTIQVRREGADRRYLAYRRSSDGGGTWSRPRRLIDFGSNTFPYAAPAASRQDRLFLAWTLYRPAGEPGHKDIFGVLSRDEGSTWETPDGKPLELPITRATAARLYVTPADRENVVWDVRLDERLDPAIAFVELERMDQEGRMGCEARVMRFDARTGAWSGPSRVRPLGYACYPGGIVIDERDTRRVIVARRTGEGCRLEAWEQATDGDWHVMEPIAGGGTKRAMHPVIPRNYRRDCDLLWLDVSRYVGGKDLDARLMARIRGGGP